MKIRDIETFLMNIGSQNRVLLRVLTDEHQHGTGEAYCVGPDEATVKTIHYFKDWLAGQDPTRIEYLWRLLCPGGRFCARPAGKWRRCARRSATRSILPLIRMPRSSSQPGPLSWQKSFAHTGRCSLK